jgi:hypothetical protein
MSHYSKIRDALGCVKQLEKEIRVGPNGEGQEWIDMLDAIAEDLEDVLDDLEPDEAEQGLIPIPAGYAEA